MKVAAVTTLTLLIATANVFPQSPTITASSPSFWAVNVNASSQKEISITFDQTLRYGFSSWIGPSSVIPEDFGKAKMSADSRNCSMAVSLQPGKVYVFALNEKSIAGVGFQSRRGAPLAPHFLVFQTIGNPTPEDAPPVVMRATPPNGAAQIDPARTTGISLVFDKPMKIEKHGLHLMEGNAPVDLSKAGFTYSPDGKVFTLNYNFKPLQTYRVELNNVHDIGFASKQRIPLWPTQLSFTTGQPR